MFGYVKPFVPELKVAQHELYRALYCGLCRAMGRVSGQTSRFTLSYDLVFLAAVRMILTGEIPELERFSCMAHPLTKKTVCSGGASLDFTAAMSAILACEKNSDDLADERGTRKLRAVMLTPFMKHIAKLGGRNLPEGTGQRIGELLARLSELEEAQCPSADETAEIFGLVLGEAFCTGLDGDKADLAYRIGKSTGRFVYLCDAADDMTEDIRKNRYNPIAAGWGPLAADAGGGMSEIVKNSIRTAAPLDLEILGEAAEELDPEHPLTPIVKNIVYLGIPKAMERAIDGGEKADKV